MIRLSIHTHSQLTNQASHTFFDSVVDSVVLPSLSSSSFQNSYICERIILEIDINLVLFVLQQILCKMTVSSGYENKAYDGDNPVKVRSLFASTIESDWIALVSHINQKTNLFFVLSMFDSLHTTTQKIPFQLEKKWNYRDPKNGEYWKMYQYCLVRLWYNSQLFR